MTEGVLLNANVEVKVKVKRLTATAKLPTYATPGSAAFDIYVDSIAEHEPEHIAAGRSRKFHTGLALEVAEGWCIKVYSRSGHGFKHGVRLENCVALIDSDYRGELMISLKSDKDAMKVCAGDRIAQAMIEPVVKACFEEVEVLGATERDTGGFGHTGA